MGYRKCPTHGWLATAEYTVSESGETICPECGVSLSGFSMEQPRTYAPSNLDQIYGASNPKSAFE